MAEDSYVIDLAIRSSPTYYRIAPYSPIPLLRCSSLLHALDTCTGSAFLAQAPFPSLNQVVTTTSPTKLPNGEISPHQDLASPNTHSTKSEDGVEVQTLGNIPNEEAGASRFLSRTLGRSGDPTKATPQRPHPSQGAGAVPGRQTDAFPCGRGTINDVCSGDGHAGTGGSRAMSLVPAY
jgi:hypothetical protein